MEMMESPSSLNKYGFDFDFIYHKHLHAMLTFWKSMDSAAYSILFFISVEFIPTKNIGYSTPNPTQSLIEPVVHDVLRYNPFARNNTT